MGISAVIITRNEEANIARCLEGLKGLVQEVVVVDSGSTDNTRRIAEAHGARVVERAWTNYSDQKNYANGLATQAYILSVDADEVPSAELARSIRAAAAAGLHGTYRMHRLTNYCGHWVRHGGWYPDTKTRLFPKGGAHWSGDHVHEVLEPAPGLPETLLRGDLLHYSYNSLEDHQERIERYSDLHAQAMFRAGRRAGVLKRWLSPLAKFMQGYLLQAGFLDGKAGWHIAVLSARAVRLKYAKLHALHHAAKA
ncbi:MAG: glycosyltransferase family 2 protein [Flavobacteriales bacterium]|nr:glycosyltransferase family 2 protein [Flavobacteriales bacterium]NUQ14689.1 glycosyltransferase family 2 protein [Flavobacteriales bacterium]